MDSDTQRNLGSKLIIGHGFTVTEKSLEKICHRNLHVTSMCLTYKPADTRAFGRIAFISLQCRVIYTQKTASRNVFLKRFLGINFV